MYYVNNRQNIASMPYENNRFIGSGFAVPFLLGGLTGGLLAPGFYPRPIPYAPYPPIPPRPYPYYRPYY